MLDGTDSSVCKQALVIALADVGRSPRALDVGKVKPEIIAAIADLFRAGQRNPEKLGIYAAFKVKYSAAIGALATKL